MDAHKAKIPDVVNSSTLIEVPFFQRAYVWKEDLWERFLDDMNFIAQYNHPHFLGTLRRWTDDPSGCACKASLDGKGNRKTCALAL